MNKPVKKVVIVGGGTAGWMAAAALGKVLGKVLDITLIESSALGTVGVGEATIPTLLTYNRLMGINEQEFMRAVKGTFKLGIAFENWTQKGHRYIHSFGITGKDHWTAGFQHFWLRGLREGHEQPYGEYCLELIAAERGRFAHLPKQGLNYAYHLDSSAYAGFLRAMAEAHGVKRIDAKIVDVSLRGEDGFIESVQLDTGVSIAGNLFLDCSGFRALLIEQALHSGFEDWTHWLPCDRAIAVQTESTKPPLPYTRSIAHDAGWQWRIPLQHRMGNGIVYSSAFLEDDAARELLLSSVEGRTLTQPNPIRFRTGMRRKHWNRNCVAVGLSDGFIEPLESTSIHLIQRSVTRLLRQFPHNGIWPSDVAEFNAQTDAEWRHVRDFIVLHYHLTQREDSGFWRQCREMSIPETLAHRMDLFEESGRVFRKEEELFGENSWTQVMLGQGLTPRDYHPVAAAMSAAELGEFLRHIRGTVAGMVEQLPTHEEYIARYCAAGDAAPN